MSRVAPAADSSLEELASEASEHRENDPELHSKGRLITTQLIFAAVECVWQHHERTKECASFDQPAVNADCDGSKADHPAAHAKAHSCLLELRCW